MTPEMKVLRETREKRIFEWRALVDRAKAENRRQTAEEKNTSAECKSAIVGLEEEIAQLAELEEREASIKVASSEILAHSEAVASSNPADNRLGYSGNATATLSGQRNGFNRPAGPSKHFGEYLQAVHRSMRSGGTTDRYLLERRATGSSEGLGADGGFLVQTDYHAEATKRVEGMSVIYQLVDKIPISANSNSIKVYSIDETSRVEGSRWGGAISYWLHEAGLKVASKPKLKLNELVLKKLICMWYATDELLEDAAAMQSIASEAFVKELRVKTEKGIVRGSGVGEPLGILNSPALVTVPKETGQAAATLQVENVLNMYARLRVSEESKVVWLCNRSVFPQLLTMGITVGTGGSPIYQPPGGLSQSPYATLLGYRVVPVEYCSALGAKGDLLVCDLSEYALAEKGGVKAASSIHVKFEYDETCFRWVFRVDGMPKPNSPLTPMYGTDTVSPFIVLAART